MIGLFWQMPNGNYLFIDEVLDYRPNDMERKDIVELLQEENIIGPF